MSIWKLAGVQMDCQLGAIEANLHAICRQLEIAAANGARLVIFPECALTGYGYPSLEAAWEVGETLNGPSIQRLQAECTRLNVWAAVGFLERDESEKQLFNGCALIGPKSEPVGYRKIHLPLLGVDRFVTPGNRPFAVHDVEDLKVGMTICYDGSFPEASRCLTLLGADLIILPTNWPQKAHRAAKYLVPARAFENHVYYAAVNRIGEEEGFRFIGLSQIVDYNGEVLAGAEDEATIIYAEIDSERARRKRIVNIPGEYEVDRIADRRPEMYGLLTRESGS